MNTRQRKKHKKLRLNLQTTERIKSWIPILESDRDWDYQFLEIILKHKLSRMVACIAKDKELENHKRVVRTINYAIYLLDRLNDNVDSEKLNEEFRAKWGDIKFTFENLEGTKFRVMNSTYTKANTPEEHEQAEADSRENYDRAAKKIDELYGRLFKHMNKYWRRWWS